MLKLVNLNSFYSNKDGNMQVSQLYLGEFPHIPTRYAAMQAILLILLLQVLDIEDPVEDSRGFVYQKQNILDYIRSKPGGITIAPIAGQ